MDVLRDADGRYKRKEDGGDALNEEDGERTREARLRWFGQEERRV